MCDTEKDIDLKNIERQIRRYCRRNKPALAAALSELQVYAAAPFSYIAALQKETTASLSDREALVHFIKRRARLEYELRNWPKAILDDGC
jgi:hypothetical protein